MNNPERAKDKFPGICDYHRLGGAEGEAGLQAYYRNTSKDGGPTEALLLLTTARKKRDRGERVLIDSYGTMVVVSAPQEEIDELEERLREAGYRRQPINYAKTAN